MPAFDNLTRQLYSTDASIYQIRAGRCAFPKTAQQASLSFTQRPMQVFPVTPRGAGTSLVGNAIGDGLIVDFSRHNRQITDFDPEKRSVRVGAGVVLDQLNEFLKPHGFCFGPDVATSSRATLGGMIANNSSGARCPIYGTTADHVISLEIVLADGRVEKIGASHESLVCEQAKIEKLVRAASTEMAERWPPGLIKRWPGYGIERFLRVPNDLTHILAGSEGTLAAIFSAELKISPLPHEKGLGLIFFASVAEAMQATVELLDLKPAAIEHIDRPLLDQTKAQLQFQAARDLLELESKPCESILIVEFYDDVSRNDGLGSRRNMTAGKPSLLGSSVAERLSILQSKKIGLRTKILTDPAQMNMVWSVRKSGLSLLTGCIGPAKPVAFIEDAAVRPAQLPEYVRGLQSIMKPLGLTASYYGHAASGLLHVRPVLDMHSAADLKKFRQVADETSALVRQFKGSLSAEHGVGIARTEYMRDQLGNQLLEVMREIKRAFDPKNVFNPGKIFEVGTSRCDVRTPQRGVPTTIDNHLRENFTRPLELPFQPVLAFAFKDRSFLGNLEQCNGCGGCLKQSGIMCPTFIATHDEVMSTRGRANIIRAALELRLPRNDASGSRRNMTAGKPSLLGDPLKSAELDAALSNCLSCKGCTPECPSNVNLALLKAEMLHARWRRDGLPLRERILSNVDLLGKLGCLMPRLTNRLLGFKAARIAMEKTIGISARRSLPHYASERFDKWFSRHWRASVPRRHQQGRAISRSPRRLQTAAPWEPRQSHPLGRHLRAVSRAAHRHGCGESTRSAWIRSCARKKPPLLRSPRIQPGKPRCRRKTRQTQPRSSFITPPLHYSSLVPGALLLVDVRRRLPRAENRKRRKHRGTLFPVREIRGRFTGARTGGTSFQARVPQPRDPHPPALSCQIDSQSGVHGHAGRTFAWKKSHDVGHSVLRNGRRIRRARRKIRSIAPNRATLARSNRQSTPGDRSNRVRHKLPPSNYRPNESPAKTHGRASRRSAAVAAAVSII